MARLDSKYTINNIVNITSFHIYLPNLSLLNLSVHIISFYTYLSTYVSPKFVQRATL